MEETGPTRTVVSSVLGDGELLRKILLRLDFPTCLVRAAAISKLWFQRASDPAFLRRFRDRHSPRLLGIYLTTRAFRQLDFVPMLPQPPQLAAVLRRGCFSLDTFERSSSSLDTDDDDERRINGMDCQNGRLFFGSCCGDGPCTCGVDSPLHPARSLVTVPAPPCRRRPDGHCQ